MTVRSDSSALWRLASLRIAAQLAPLRPAPPDEDALAEEENRRTCLEEDDEAEEAEAAASLTDLAACSFAACAARTPTCAAILHAYLRLMLQINAIDHTELVNLAETRISRRNGEIWKPPL